MLSIFYRSAGLKETHESIKILNNVYLTIFKPTGSSKVNLNDFKKGAPGEQTQMVLIKGKLGQFKAIWPCGGGDEVLGDAERDEGSNTRR